MPSVGFGQSVNVRLNVHQDASSSSRSGQSSSTAAITTAAAPQEYTVIDGTACPIASSAAQQRQEYVVIDGMAYPLASSATPQPAQQGYTVIDSLPSTTLGTVPRLQTSSTSSPLSQALVMVRSRS